jgi:hypothetical protein
VWVVRDDDRPDEHVVLDRHQFREAAAVDADTTAHAAAELEHRVGAHADVVAEPVVLADAGALAGVQAGADHAARLHRREGTHDGAGADVKRGLALASAPRRLADDARRLQITALTERHNGIQTYVVRSNTSFDGVVRRPPPYRVFSALSRPSHTSISSMPTTDL